jgi:hypothetical protein
VSHYTDYAVLEMPVARERLRCYGTQKCVGGEIKGLQENGVGIQHALQDHGA